MAGYGKSRRCVVKRKRFLGNNFFFPTSGDTDPSRVRSVCIFENRKPRIGSASPSGFVLSTTQPRRNVCVCVCVRGLQFEAGACLET